MQMGWVRKCFAYARSQHDYSHYIRTRPDLYIGAPVPQWVFAPRNAHRLFSMDKDARGSDMFFVVSRAVMSRWFNRLSFECGAMPDTYAEYIIFESSTGVVVTGGYDRSRCNEMACIAALPPLPVPEDAEPPPDSEALVAADTEGNFTRIHQLPNMRNIIVRNARTVSCWKMGFWCRPDDQARLLALLGPYNCSVQVGTRRGVVV